jgi:hypothetical protein
MNNKLKGIIVVSVLFAMFFCLIANTQTATASSQDPIPPYEFHPKNVSPDQDAIQKMNMQYSTKTVNTQLFTKIVANPLKITVDPSEISADMPLLCWMILSPGVANDGGGFGIKYGGEVVPIAPMGGPDTYIVAGNAKIIG